MAANAFRHEGEYWTIAYQGIVVRVRDVIGIRYLAYLLRYPHQQIHVLDLQAFVESVSKGVAVDQIQGNILPGFNKDYQAFLFLKIVEGEESHFRNWLKGLRPSITSAKQVLAFTLLLAKTNGNPFFVNAFLKSLYTDDLLTFDFQQQQWQWKKASSSLLVTPTSS